MELDEILGAPAGAWTERFTMYDEYGTSCRWRASRAAGCSWASTRAPAGSQRRHATRELAVGPHQGRAAARRGRQGRRRGQRHRGGDRGQGGRAGPAAAGRGQPDPRHLARLREDPAGGGPAGRPGFADWAGVDLVAPTATSRRWPSRTPTPRWSSWPGARASATRRTWRGHGLGTRAAHRRDRLARDPRRAAGGGGPGRRASRAAALGRPALGRDRAPALRRQGDRRDHLRAGRPNLLARRHPAGRGARRPGGDRHRELAPVHRARADRPHAAGGAAAAVAGGAAGWETAVLFRAAGTANEVGGDFYDTIQLGDAGCPSSATWPARAPAPRRSPLARATR